MVTALIKENIASIKTYFTPRLFLRGLFVGALIYVVIAAYVFFKASDFEEKQIATLPHKTTVIKNIGSSAVIQGHMAATTGEENSSAKSKFPHAHPLDSVPVAGLYEESPNGLKPIIRESDGLTPFEAYRRPFDKNVIGKKPIISLGLYEVGISQVASESALRTLPPEISFILSPYTPDTSFWVRQARSYGHEVWMILPMETEHYPRHDTGAHTLLTQTPFKENAAKLDWVMGSTVGYAGFIAPRNPTYLESLEDTRPILHELAKRGLGFINTSQYSSAVIKNLYLGLNAPYGHAPIWLDIPPSKDDIQAKLAELEDMARKQGHAAAILNTLPITYQEIIAWYETLEDKGFVLAPLSIEAEL